MSTVPNKFQKINTYLHDHFDNRIIADLHILLECDKKKNENSTKKAQLSFTIPYLLLVSAGIDFLGGLELGFANNNSKERSCHFMMAWMSLEYKLYAFSGMATFIYDSVRNGIIHQAIFKRDIESYKGLDCYNRHLFVREDSSENKRIFIHTKHLVDDFLNAYVGFKNDYIQGDNVDILYARLFKEKEKNNINSSELIKQLENEGYIFQDDLEPSPSPAPPEE